MYVVIRAGGSGSRLWPLSREKKPKQLQALISDKTLLRETVDRMKKIVKTSNIFVSANEVFLGEVKKIARDIPANNFIAEPFRRDTTAAIGLEAAIIHKRDPRAIIVSVASDHVVKYEDEFKRILKASEKMVKKYPRELLQIGIHPTYPDIGYGYIKCGKMIDEINHLELFKVAEFTEKPDLKTAKKFLASGRYLWNANMFMWKASTILELYQELVPKTYAHLNKISNAYGKSSFGKVLHAEYRKIEQIPIDYSILEKTDRTVTVAANIGWNDIGDWPTLKDELADSESTNVIHGQAVEVDTENLLIHGQKKKLYAAFGVKDLIIVDTDDVLLVCDKHRGREIKKLINKIKEQKKDKYL